MPLEKNGLLEDRIMSLYRKSLDYLTETGFDFKEKPSSEWKMDMSASNIDNLFDGLREGAYDLPVPYKIGKDVLSETFMDVYGLEKEIDLVRYIRVVRIILTDFKGPKESDSYKGHINTLRIILRLSYPGYQEDMILKALYVYEQSLGKRAQCHSTLSKSDYISFARILNAKFNLYNSEEKLGLALIFFMDIHKKLMTFLQTDQTRVLLFERLRYYNITDIDSAEELLPLITDSRARTELIKKINIWFDEQQKDNIASIKQSFKMHYCYLTDETLLEMIKHPIYAMDLLNNLTKFGVADIKSNSELTSMAQKPDVRAALLRKLKVYCEKEYQMKFD
ncbi:MAG TPA: hypothetical protein VMZ29_15730 [Candidatus Bathyarchaeia archaeon]|nr:hypothetical protein [Candidatus Bathyarchaeia archaeon]